jgi:hypothetical protein
MISGMVRRMRLWGFAVLFMLLFAGSEYLTRARANDPTPLTTESAEYCLQLQSLVGEALQKINAPPPPEVRNLSDEGGRMCRQGKLRGGIIRLRHALMMLHQATPPDRQSP